MKEGEDIGTYAKGTEWEHVFQDALEFAKNKKIYNLVVTFAYKDKEDDIATAYFTHGSHYGNTGLLHTVLKDREIPIEGDE